MAIESSDGTTLEPITRLDDEGLSVVCGNPDGSLRNITDDVLVFEARYKYTDETPLITKTSAVPTQIQKTNPVNGQAKVLIGPADTSPIAKTSTVTLKCQLEVTDASGKTTSILFDLPVRYRR